MRSVVLGICAALALAAPALAYDPQREWDNFSRNAQRFSHDQATAEYHAAYLQDGLGDLTSILARDAAEGGERFSGSLCGSGTLTCAGDPRVTDWGGLVIPVTYINRNGAHIDGHVWAQKDAVAKRVRKTRRARRAKLAPLPGVVLETGSIQAPERWYLWAAQVLANHGYVVMTFDVQGQGNSDLMGTHDEHAFDGVPAQDVTHFVEDLQDAIDFFHSTADKPYVPRSDHAKARQEERKAAGKVQASNPLAALLDRTRLGIVGHSLGAEAVSILQSTDERVDAAVAWDGVSSGTGVTPRVPMLGMSADYSIVPTPFTADPDRAAKGDGVRAWSAKGIPSMEVVLRGTHFEWSYSPGPLLAASLRGIDAAAWYTTAWLDRYVAGEDDAEARLLTRRWLSDPIDRVEDPSGDGNLLSFYYDSPLNLGGGTACADLRTNCQALLADDGESPTPYSFMEDRG
jgi:dienelactone hydrolase